MRITCPSSPNSAATSFSCPHNLISQSFFLQFILPLLELKFIPDRVLENENGSQYHEHRKSNRIRTSIASLSHLLFLRSASAWPLIFSSAPPPPFLSTSILSSRLRGGDRLSLLLLRLNLLELFPSFPRVRAGLGLPRRGGGDEGDLDLEGLLLRRRGGLTLRRLP